MAHGPKKIFPPFGRYRKLLVLLKKYAPPAYPVHVRRKPLANHLEGACWRQGKQFHVHVCSKIDEQRAIDVLLHEWAHALAWNNLLDAAKTDEEFNKHAHGPEWGVAYSKVYAVYEDHFIPAVS
jgi:hypothetical protein